MPHCPVIRDARLSLFRTPKWLIFPLVSICLDRRRREGRSGEDSGAGDVGAVYHPPRKHNLLALGAVYRNSVVSLLPVLDGTLSVLL